MIVIFTDSEDNYTHGIIEWLNFYNCPFVQVDLFKESESNISISLGMNSEIYLRLDNGDTIDFNTVSYFFYRGGNFNLKIELMDDETTPAKIKNDFLRMEFDTLVDFVYQKIQQKCIGWLDQKPLNKLIQLEKAKELGIEIPNSWILHSKVAFKKQIGSKKVVSKAIQENIGVQRTNAIYIQRVVEIDYTDLADVFYPSMFQEIIDKVLEIRAYYLDGHFYSIAFLNKKENCSVDMRDNYNNHINFRFDLSKDLEQKLTALMCSLNLVSGSIDLILGKDKKIYFLEVNPEGQYEWVSVYGNYNLDKKIAEFLVEKHVNNENKKNTERTIAY